MQQTGPKNLMRLQGDGLLKDFMFHFLPQVQTRAFLKKNNNQEWTTVTIIVDHISWNAEARAWIAKSLLEKDGLFKLSNDDIVSICKFTEGIHTSCC